MTSNLHHPSLLPQKLPQQCWRQWQQPEKKNHLLKVRTYHIQTLYQNESETPPPPPVSLQLNVCGHPPQHGCSRQVKLDTSDTRPPYTSVPYSYCKFTVPVPVPTSKSRSRSTHGYPTVPAVELVIIPENFISHFSHHCRQLIK